MTDTEQLQRWVEAGLVSPEQAEAIRDFESQTEKAPEGRIPVVAEALGYLGGGLAFVAAWLLGVELWPELEPWARVALVAVITAVVAGAGAWVRSSDEPAAQRLTTFLWFLSSIGVAFTVGLVADALEAEEQIAVLVGALGATIYSFALWMLRRSVLQQVALFGGLVVTVEAFLANLEVNIDPMFFGLALFALSLAWGLLAWAEIVEPQTVGIVLGGLGMILGSQFGSFEDDALMGLSLGIATAVIFLVTGVVVRRMLLLAMGAGAVIIFVPQLVNFVFGDALAAVLALLVVGLGIVVGAVVVARSKDEQERAEAG